VSASEMTFAEGVFEHALRELQSESRSASDRARAATVLNFVSRLVPLSEGRASDLMNIAASRLAEPHVVSHVLRSLRRSRDGAKLTSGVARLADRAHREGQRGALFARVVAMQQVAAWRLALRDEWVMEVLDDALAEGRAPAARAIAEAWLAPHAADSVPVALRAIVERHSQFLGTKSLSPALRWRLHAAAPTARGWRVMASTAPKSDKALSPSQFSSELDIAIETLEVAMAQEPERSRRVVLARWLSDIQG
jgi:hypothetical protein